MEAELLNTDGQKESRTDMKKLIAAFQNLANASKMVTSFKRIKTAETAVVHPKVTTLDICPERPLQPRLTHKFSKLSNL